MKWMQYTDDIPARIDKKDDAKNFCMRMFQWDKGVIFLGDVLKKVVSGSVAFIPGHRTQKIRNTGQTVFFLVCLIPSRYPEL